MRLNIESTVSLGIKQARSMLLLIVSLIMVGVSIFGPIGAHASAYTSPYYAARVNSSASLSSQAAQVVAKGSTVYVADYNQCYVYKITASITSIVAGIPDKCGYSPDGSIASQSTLDSGPTSIDIGADGTVYIAEPYAHYIRAVLPDGSLATVAGNGAYVDASQLTDATAATQTAFDYPAYVKVGPDNAIYTYDSGIIRRILPDGSTDHVAGAFGSYTSNNPYVEGGVATEHAFGTLQEAFNANYFWKSWSLFDFDNEGNMLATSGGEIYTINLSTDVIHRYYTPSSTPTYTLEDEPLSEENFGTFTGFEVDNNGKIWIASYSYAVQYIDPNDKIVHTVAGGGQTPAPTVGNQLYLSSLMSISVDNNGQIYYIGNDSTGATYVGTLSTANPDSTPPVIKSQLPPANGNGWYNNPPINLSWSVTDPESGITGESGCDPVTITNDSVTTFTCTATSAGGTDSDSITVKIDSMLPTITYSQSPTPNANDWNNGSVTVTFICTDNSGGSGIASCTPPVTLSDEGTNQSATGVATDNAGNVSRVSVTVNIDKTPPVISNLSLSTRVVTSLGAKPLLITADASDNLSGIVGGEYYIDTDPGQGNGKFMPYANGEISASTTINGLSLGIHTIYVRALDKAGNWSTPTSKTFLFL